MNTQEGTDLVKMSITALMLVMLIGAVLGLWYMLSDKTNDYVRHMNEASASVNMDKFRELEDMAKTNADGVLTSVVSAALQEFRDDDLLYIYTVVPNHSKPIIYTYETTDVSNSFNVSNCTLYRSTTPTVHCAKLLLQYTDKRCTVEVQDITDNAMNFVGLIIKVIN